MNALVLKLDRYAHLSVEEKSTLQRVVNRRQRSIPPKHDIALEGSSPVDVRFVLSGWAIRYKHLADGRRQILSFLLPGDLCDLNGHVLRALDHSLAAVTPVALAELNRQDLEEVTGQSRRMALALLWQQETNAAIQREWIMSLGRRTALERLAHLLCELFLRLRAVNLTDGDRCDMPATQLELAEATGLSAVHVNRVLQQLRDMQVIRLKGRNLTVLDLPRLQEIALFNADYLHFDREGRNWDASTPAAEARA